MANKKITELTELASAEDSDLLAVVDDPAGSAETKKITKANLLSGTGKTYYAAVVASSGGDYTTVGAAIADGATNIFVTNGTYNESALSNATANITIVGESRENAIINIQGNAWTLSGNGISIQNVKFQSSGGALTLSGDNWSVLESDFYTTGTTKILVMGGQSSNCNFSNNQVVGTSTGNGNGLVNLKGIDNCVIEGNNFESSSTTEFHALIYSETEAMDYCVFANNVMDASGADNCHMFLSASTTFNGNVFSGNLLYCDNEDNHHGLCFMQTGGTACDQSDSLFVGNSIYACRGRGIDTKSGNQNTITGNWIQADYGVHTNGGWGNVIEGNYFNMSGSNKVGVFLQSHSYASVFGNSFFSETMAVTVDSGCESVSITGNHFGIAAVTAQVSDSGAFTNILTNHGYISPMSEKKFMYCKNTDGDGMVEGDLVVIKAVAAGNEVTHTTTAGDDKVYGMAADTIANNGSGYVQVLGFTDAMKVDGTTDIAVGDFIGTFTSEGIGQKAGSGDMAIAIALEAYSTDDSSGVIDALLITPRKI